MGPELIYIIGISVAVVMALIWSFVLDKQKPPSAKEFIAKLVARALFFIALMAIFMGFCIRYNMRSELDS